MIWRRWLRRLGRLRCRWFDKHVDDLYTVGHNVGKECRFCRRHGSLTAEEIALYLGGGG